MHGLATGCNIVFFYARAALKTFAVYSEGCFKNILAYGPITTLQKFDKLEHEPIGKPQVRERGGTLGFLCHQLKAFCCSFGVERRRKIAIVQEKQPD